jgi:uncharacterized protein (TIGR03086 family)
MSFTKTVALPITPEEAFALITEPDRLRRWQAVSAVVDLRAGGAWRWTVTPGHVAAGTIREVEPGRRVVLGWGWDGDDDLEPDASTVTLTVEPADGGSLVTLVHEGLTEAQATMHAEGWNHYLGRLEALATLGDAGPDDWAWAPEPLGPITAADAALAVIQPMLRSLTAQDRAKQTPCTEFTCAQVVEHLIGSLTQLAAMVGATVVDPEGGSMENRVAVVAGQAIDAWRTVDLDDTVSGPDGSSMPASFGASLLAIELLLHGWDIAQGAGRELRVSEEVVTYVRTLADPIVPGGRRRGSFADEVTPADSASALDRFAAFAGRTPAPSDPLVASAQQRSEGT